MIKLPTEAVAPKIVNPKKMVIFAHTKVGKTTALSFLQSSLLLDIENGAEYVSALRLNVQEECKNLNMNPLQYFTELGSTLEQHKSTNGKYPYDYLIVDTITKIEDFARRYATFLYKQQPLGKSYTGNDVVIDLPNGAGYGWLRQAFEDILAPLEGKCNTCLILVGHVKNSSINKNGKDLQAKDLDLTGKLKGIVCAGADAIGYMFRNPQNANQTILSFKTHEQDLATGARPAHLSNQEFVICELTNPDFSAKKEERKFVTHWDKIFLS